MQLYIELEQLVRNYNQLELNKVVDYEKFCMISIIWHSTKIEGCSLTETDTKVLLDRDITAAGKPLKDHLMIKDHFRAFNYIIQQSKLKRKLSIDLIKEIGSLVMENTGCITKTVLGEFDSSKGDLRLVQVYVDKKYFPDFKKVPDLLDDLCKSVNLRINNVIGNEIIDLAADLHYNFVNIHPFGDGNGRTARLLMNYILLFHGQPLIKIFTDDRVEYIEALNKSEELSDISIFREFIIKQQIKFLRQEIEKYNNKDNNFNLLF